MLINSKAQISITLSDNGSAVLRFAEQELAKYLSQALALGKGEGIPFFLQIDDSVAGPEGMRLRITKDAVYISGSDERGVLYGVYEFLERYVGCSFGAMAHPEVTVGEFVPTLDSLDLPEEEYSHKADLPYRTAIVQFNVWAGEADRGLTLPFFDWLAKNRYNRLLLWVSCYEKLKELGLLPELQKRGFELTVGHHQSIFTFLPPYGNEFFPTHYREEHPEYYRLQENGERFAPTKLSDYNGQWLLCSRNEDCLQTVADNILRWLEQNPLVNTIAFWPNDGKESNCCCPDCARYTKTQNYLYFNSELASRIAEKRPDVKIDTLIYMDLWDCPEGTKLSDHIVIDVAMCTKDFRPCGKRDGGSILGTIYEQNMLTYRNCCQNVVAYDYYMGNYGNFQKVVPAADEMQSIFSAMKQKGLSGSGTQIECFNHWNNLFNFYCFARTAYDISLSWQQQMERFVRLFGRGARAVEEILHLYEETIEGQVSFSKAGTYLIEHIDKERVYSLYDAALQAAETPLARNNIRLLRMAFRYGDLVTSDPVAQKSCKPVEFEDKTGELVYMATHFDSYYANYTGAGIALPIAGHTDAPPPNDWYCFE